MQVGNRARACALAVLLLAGCVSEKEARKEVTRVTEEARVAPAIAPTKSITSFNSALRCMDNLMLGYGVKGVTVLVEDLQDATKKVNAGTKDMLISAVSDMTRRSNAVRLVAYGADSANVIGFLKEAERKSAYQNLPDYDIRGSISQFDQDVARKSADVGASIAGVGASKAVSASTQILGLDLTMLRTEDLSIVPGVTSRNSATILKEGTGVDAGIEGGRVLYQKFGVNYSSSLSRSEGSAQALRNLVELAVVELFGRLVKIPYWTCLGADGNDEVVRTEIQDWYYSLYGNPANLITYFQWQMKVRGFYEGEINGEADEELREAVRAYRRALGLDASARIDQEFFAAYLQANHGIATAGARQYLVAVPARPRPVAPVAATAPAPQPAAPAARAAPIDLTLTSNSENWLFLRGEEIRLSLGVNRDAHLACYSQDETGAVSRFFPNRFASGSLLSAGRTLQIPGSMQFKLVANRAGQKERILCVAATRDLMGDMPARVVGTDFDRLPVQSLDDVAKAYELVTDASVALRMVDVLVR